MKDVKKAISELGMTQKEFGGLVGADRMSLRNYSLGKVPEKMEKYLKLVFYIIENEGVERLREIFGE